MLLFKVQEVAYLNKLLGDLLTLLSSDAACLCLPGLGGTDKRFLPFSCWNKSRSLETRSNKSSTVLMASLV